MLRRIGGTRPAVPVQGVPCRRPLAARVGVPLGWVAPQGKLARWAPERDGLIPVEDGPRHTAHVSVSPNGEWVAVAGNQRVQRRRGDGTLVSEHGIPHGIRAVAVSDDGRLLLGGGDARTWLGPVDESGQLAHLSTHNARVSALAWIDEDQYLSGDVSGVLVLVHAAAGRARRVGRLGGAIRAVVRFGERSIAAADDDGRVVIWADTDATPVGLKTSLGPIRGLHDAGAGELWVVGAATAVRADSSGQVRARVPIARDHRDVHGLAGVAAGVVWTWDGTGLWGWDPTAELGPWWGHTGGVRAIQQIGADVWTGDRAGQLRVWSPRDGSQRLWFSTGRAGVQVLTASSDNGVCFGTTAGQLGCAHAETGPAPQRTQAHEGPITALQRVELPAAGAWVVLSGGADGVLRVWDDALQPLGATVVHGDRLRCLAVDGAGRALTGGYDGALVLSEPLAGRVLRRITAHERPVTGCAVARDGALVSASLDGTVRRWGQEGAERACQEVDEDGVVSLCLLEGGDLVAVGRGGWVTRLSGPALRPVARVQLGRALDAVAPVGSGLLVSDQRGGLHRLAVCDAGEAD